MPTCENIQQLRNLLFKSLEESLLNAATKGEIQAILLEAIEEGVYQDYEPKKYERREDEGGLGDPRLIDSQVSHNPFTITVSLTMHSKAMAKRRKQGEIPVEHYVVHGLYDWEKSEIAQRPDPSRDFYALAEEKLSPVLAVTIQNELARLNIDTE